MPDVAEPQPSWPLTAAIARGDESAFSRFYDLWFDRVLAAVRSFTRRDEAFCLDIVQDCMLRVVKRMRALASEDAVAAWMTRTALRLAIDGLRREQRRQRRERAAARGEADAAPDLGRALLDGEQVAWLRARLAELPERDRALLIGRFQDGQTLAEVGSALGMTGHAAHGRIWRLLRRLRGAAEEAFS